MDYINNWFHFYSTTESFKDHRELGVINPDSICFLNETGQIYTQNSFFGIPRDKFDELEQLILDHDSKIKDILGIESGSATDSIDSISEAIKFLDGFKDDENLKDIINSIRDNLQGQISSVHEELLDRATSIENSITDNVRSLQEAINSLKAQNGSINTRLDSYDTEISSISTSLISHINEYKTLKASYDAFKEYTENRLTSSEGSIRSLNSSVNVLKESVSGLNDNFDEIESKLVRVETALNEAKNLIDQVNERFDEATLDIEQFKTEVNNYLEILRNSIGAPDGIAPLDSSGKVPSAYLPSYVDDVLEYPVKILFPSTGETGKIYVDTSTNLSYRWSGSTYVELSKSLGLGETSSTAYPGDKGKSTTDRLTNHVSDYDNPHKVTKLQIGLGNVDNTSDMDKPISTAVQQALNNKVEIEPGKGLVDIEASKNISAVNERMNSFEEALNLEVSRATTAELNVNSALATHKSDNDNPHGVTKKQVGLENADNTSDLDKPVSTAQAAAIKVVQDDLNSHEDNKSNPHNVTKDQVGLGNVDNTSDKEKPISDATQAALDTLTSSLEEHKEDKTNPHEVTKEQVGLGNADNTADADKPISTATQAALDVIENTINDHISDTSNPHQVTKEQMGLGNVDDTSDIDKPISTAVQSELDRLEEKIDDSNSETGSNIQDLDASISSISEQLNTHKEDKDNPHEVTKVQIGLSNVTNDAQVKRSEMGVASGVATLGGDGKLSSVQLPSLKTINGNSVVGSGDIEIRFSSASDDSEGLMSASDHAKLSGIDDGATADSALTTSELNSILI